MIMLLVYLIYFIVVICYAIFFYFAVFHFRRYDIKRATFHPVIVIYFILSIIAIISTLLLSFSA